PMAGSVIDGRMLCVTIGGRRSARSAWAETGARSGATERSGAAVARSGSWPAGAAETAQPHSIKRHSFIGAPSLAVGGDGQSAHIADAAGRPATQRAVHEIAGGTVVRRPLADAVETLGAANAELTHATHQAALRVGAGRDRHAGGGAGV